MKSPKTQLQTPKKLQHGGITAVTAEGKILILNESGKLAVLQASRDWRVLAVNDLAENCYATPAIADGVILVRSEHSLWAFQNQ